MPPRFAYWTILLDGKPTAFRAAEQEELLPTFKRLKEKHPDAVMQWFARGRLWSSPEEARADTARRAEAADAPARGRNWRPGGSHSDPRQPYKDAKKQRNQERRQRRFDFRSKDAQAGGSPNDPAPKKEWSKAPAPRESKPWSDRPKPAGGWPRDERQDRPGPKTGGWDKRPARPRDDRPADARPPKKEWGGPPAEGRREFKPWNDRPKPAARWPRDERQDRPGSKTGGWDKRPARPRDDRPAEARPPRKEWGGPPAEGRREFKPWNDRPKPAGRWPRDERQDRPGPKTGGWDKRPARPRDDRSAEARPPKKEWGGPPAAGRRDFKPWNDRPKPPGRWPRDERQDGPGPKTGGWNKRPAGPREASGARPPSDKPAHSRSGDRPPFKGPRDGGFRGNGPRTKGPRGPKR